MAPDCLVPREALAAYARDGGPPVPMCWLCAHLVTEHGAELDTIPAMDRCSCTREDIYPADVAARRAAIVEPARSSDYAQRPEFVGTSSERWVKLKERLAPHVRAQDAPRSLAVPAKVRQAQNRAAASKTALARRGAVVDADRVEATDAPEAERHGVDRVVARRN